MPTVSTGGTPTQYPAVTLVNADGTAYDPANVPKITATIDWDGNYATGESVPPRSHVVSNALTMTSGTLVLTYFTASTTETITQVRTWNGATAAAATPTICRIGIYSVAANGDVALLAATTNDTALWNTASTEYTKALATSFSKVAGTRYAVGELIVTGAATPTRRGKILGSAGSANGRALWGRSPRLSGRVITQTDLPASVVNASILDWEQFIHVDLLP